MRYGTNEQAGLDIDSVGGVDGDGTRDYLAGAPSDATTGEVLGGAWLASTTRPGGGLVVRAVAGWPSRHDHPRTVTPRRTAAPARSIKNPSPRPPSGSSAG